MTGHQRTEFEWFAHCDYLRALQRLGHESLAHHDQRMVAPPLGVTVLSGVNAALTRGWTAAVVVFRGPARAAHALHPRASSSDGERQPLTSS